MRRAGHYRLSETECVTSSSLPLLPLLAGHDYFHELVKGWDSECGIRLKNVKPRVKTLRFGCLAMKSLKVWSDDGGLDSLVHAI